jgi:hypothetical protein
MLGLSNGVKASCQITYKGEKKKTNFSVALGIYHFNNQVKV